VVDIGHSIFQVINTTQNMGGFVRYFAKETVKRLACIAVISSKAGSYSDDQKMSCVYRDYICTVIFSNYSH
jgi:hypothetical protein